MFDGAPNRRGWAPIVSISICLACSDPEPPGANETTGESGDASSSQGSADTGGEFESLIDHAAWTQLEAGDDPLAEHRPSLVECGIAGWYVEDETLEIDTNQCNYLALGQPSLAPITAGRLVQLDFYHFDLVAPEPALAHLAVLVDGELLWEQEVEIPGDAKVYTLEFESPLTAPAGAPLVFHLHNHGQNTWALQGLAAEQ